VLAHPAGTAVVPEGHILPEERLSKGCANKDDRVRKQRGGELLVESAWLREASAVLRIGEYHVCFGLVL
jgi:hypothetical protein